MGLSSGGCAGGNQAISSRKETGGRSKAAGARAARAWVAGASSAISPPSETRCCSTRSLPVPSSPGPPEPARQKALRDVRRSVPAPPKGAFAKSQSNGAHQSCSRCSYNAANCRKRATLSRRATGWSGMTNSPGQMVLKGDLTALAGYRGHSSKSRGRACLSITFCSSESECSAAPMAGAFRSSHITVSRVGAKPGCRIMSSSAMMT
mmetsp:Transcript_159941/g.489266  ORF Transcript_159941/g.489266 Transcript_159941/m.489266 type:complete len:207 (-) Transcript_159941:423-1043(-)